MNVCNSCEWRPFSASLSEPDGPEGFSPLPNFAGYVRRCDACRDKLYDEQRAYERTLEAMYAYELAGSEEGARELLRRVRPPDYRFPVITRCETGQLPADPRAFTLQEPLNDCPKCGALDCTKNHAEFM